MKYVLGLAVAMAVIGCDGENAKSCAYACDVAHQKMLSWSQYDGCRCAVDTDRDGGR